MSKNNNKIIHIVFVHMIVWLGVITFLSILEENDIFTPVIEQGTVATTDSAKPD